MSTGTLLKPIVKTARPPMYKVIVLNDDFTPIDFVVHVLQKHFHLVMEEAAKLTMEIHQKGSAVVMVTTFEIAETKQMMVIDHARREGHPLLVVLEADDPGPEPEAGGAGRRE